MSHAIACCANVSCSLSVIAELFVAVCVLWQLWQYIPVLKSFIYVFHQLLQYWNALGKAPQLEIETSTYAIDWQKVLKQPQYADVVFIDERQHSFRAHKIVLCSASPFFRQVLNPVLTSQVLTWVYKWIVFPVMCILLGTPASWSSVVSEFSECTYWDTRVMHDCLWCVGWFVMSMYCGKTVHAGGRVIAEH